MAKSTAKPTIKKMKHRKILLCFKVFMNSAEGN